MRVVRLERRGSHVASQRLFQVARVVKETPTQIHVAILYRPGNASGAVKRYRRSDGFKIPYTPGDDPVATWHVVGEPFEGEIVAPAPDAEGHT